MSDHDLAGRSNGVSRPRGGVFEDLVLSTDVVDDVLNEIVRSAAAAIGDHASAVVVLELHGRTSTRASSDDRGAELAEVQYACEAGPALTAMHARRIVAIRDLAREERFGQYGPRAVSLGARSCVSLPLDDGGRGVGALTFFSHRADAFGPAELVVARSFADEASRALSLVLLLADRVEITAQLRIGLIAQAEVDQATGILMQQYQCSAEAAHALLLVAARDRHVALAVVAFEVTTAASRAQPPEGFPPDM